ncbi:hypothetical protein HG531_011576 [Fusarium graminearum]|nr:hypothetical protein HG531_011576 [Fusarium graminearum]
MLELLMDTLERESYRVIGENLALLLTLGLHHADGSDSVESWDSELLIRVLLLLRVLELLKKRLTTLVLHLLGRRGALWLLGFGKAIGGGVLGRLCTARTGSMLVLDSFCSCDTHCDGGGGGAWNISLVP